MKIWIDIDETIAASFSTSLHHLNKTLGTNLEFDNLITHNWEDLPMEPRLSKDEALSLWWEFERLTPDQSHIPPIRGSHEKLDLLVREGHELVAITGRFEWHAREGTVLWVHRNFPDIFQEIHFTNHGVETRKNKSEVCLEMGIELMIEDNLDFALDLANHGIKVYLLEKPWNRWREERHPLITRVTDWDGIPSDF